MDANGNARTRGSIFSYALTAGYHIFLNLGKWSTSPYEHCEYAGHDIESIRAHMDPPSPLRLALDHG